MAGDTASDMATVHRIDRAADPAFDEALAHIRELSVRLHAVLDLHDPRRTLLGGRVCRCCSQRFPCSTVQAGRAAG